MWISHYLSNSTGFVIGWAFGTSRPCTSNVLAPNEIMDLWNVCVSFLLLDELTNLASIGSQNIFRWPLVYGPRTSTFWQLTTKWTCGIPTKLIMMW